MTLRVTFEIVPFGDESLKRQIDVLEISNIGTTGEYCDYRIHGTDLGVTGHCREDGARELVRRALEVLHDASH